MKNIAGIVVLMIVVIATVAIIVFFQRDKGTDWPQWGRDASKNMASPEKNLPITFDPGKMDFRTEVVDMKTTRNVKWVAKLGSHSYGNVTVAGGKVFVGTNNESPRDKRHKGDRGNVLCLDEKTGKFLWQLVVPKLGVGKVGDWEYLGICSSPTVDENRVYVVTNRCEVVCLDVDGFGNGNDGPFKDEGQYMVGTGKPAMEVGPTDADIIWRYDMIDDLSVFPHNIASSSILVAGDKLFVTTSNGQDWSHVNIPNPRAPTLICLDKKTGKLIGEEGAGISRRLYHCNWSSPAYGVVNGQSQVVFAAGDGFCYGFDPKSVKDEDGFGILPELWRFDCNPPEYKMKEGKKIRYTAFEGPCECIATPVIHKNRAYIAIGQDPEHGEGVGCLNCIDLTKRGDTSTSGVVWKFQGIERTISTVSIANDLLFVADYTGRVFCLDADTGKQHWMHDTESSNWASTLVADGKVYIGVEDGMLYVFKADKKLELLGEVDMGAPLYSSAVAANGVLYIATESHLYAVSKEVTK